MEKESPANFDCHRSRRFRLWLHVVLLGSFALPVSARFGSPPLSLQLKVQPLQTVQQLILPATDRAAELAADGKMTVPSPLRFAVEQKVNVTPATHGTWEQLTNGRLWRLRIQSAGASDLNFGFTRLWLPEGATLHVISESEPYFQGPYTARDNKPHGQLWTPVVPGEAAMIELFVPAEARQPVQLVLGHVSAGYRDLFHKQNLTAALQAEATCNIDVVCPIAAAWTNEIRSVGVYTINGAWACSGTLIADAAGDFRNYFLTANHCNIDIDNAATVVVYWNYQSTNCGTHGPGFLAHNQSGATFRAGKFDVDFTLIELDEMPDPSFGVYYSGWDRSGVAPTGGVGIHHPEADVKAISFCSNALTTVNSCIGTGGTNTHWQVIWSAGVTQPGSSGSGFWDAATHLLVGTLSGGGVTCSTPTYPDCYGKFSVAWASGDSSSDRLSDWLDPQNTGVTSVQGADPALASIIMPAGVLLVSENCSPTNGAIDPGETVTVGFALQNLGGVATTNLVATLLSAGGVIFPSAPQTYGALAGGGSAVFQSYSFTATGTCGGMIYPTFQFQDGTRNLGVASFGLMLGAPIPTVVFAENFDGVTAPTLPVGWISSVSGVGPAWAVSTARSDTSPNSAFAGDPNGVSDNQLISPTISINSTNVQLTFRHCYNSEQGYDGGALEISINGRAFTDIVSAGGTFVTNGYNATISSYYQNPLAGRPAWSGNSGGFVTTAVNLPPGAAGQTIRLRWRFGSDNSSGGTGWYVDTISVSGQTYVCCTSLVQPVIVNPRHIPGDHISFSYDTFVGQTYFVETSTNLAAPNWTTLQTNLGDGSPLSFTNSTAEETRRYFRLRTE
jgi:hypothetical protein